MNGDVMDEKEAKALAEQVAKLIVDQAREELGKDGSLLYLSKYLGRATADWEWYLDYAKAEYMKKVL